MRLVLAAVLAASLPLALVAAPAWQTPAASPPPSPPGTAAAWPRGARMALSLSFDDGRASQVTRGHRRN